MNTNPILRPHNIINKDIQLLPIPTRTYINYKKIIAYILLFINLYVLALLNICYVIFKMFLSTLCRLQIVSNIFYIINSYIRKLTNWRVCNTAVYILYLVA